MDAAQFLQAMSFGPVRDFEDMMQYQCALAGGCDVIITNDRKGFEEQAYPSSPSEIFIIGLKGTGRITAACAVSHGL